MPLQYLRVVNRRVPAQVRRRRHQHPVRRGQLARHHPRRQIEATTNRRIEALADQVDLAVVEMPVRGNGRVATQELGQQWQHIQAPEHRAHAHPQQPGRLAFAAGQVGHGVLDGAEAVTDLPQKSLPGLGQGQLAGTTLEQPHPQARFQLGNMLAHGSRGNAEAPGGLGKAADFGTADEAFQRVERFHGHDWQPKVYSADSDCHLISR
ncbi:hypothetical protein D3C76_670850 [compost metagenome]